MGDEEWDENGLFKKVDFVRPGEESIVYQTDFYGERKKRKHLDGS